MGQNPSYTVTHYIVYFLGTPGWPDGTVVQLRLATTVGGTTAGYVRFHQEGSVIPNDSANSTGAIYMHLPIARYVEVMDLLRNESPIYFSYSSQGQRAMLATSSEPVGEGE
jgi:hypothetical protein